MAKKQANQYDRIFKENIEAVIPGLMAKLLGINSIESEELPDDRDVGPDTAYQRA